MDTAKAGHFAHVNNTGCLNVYNSLCKEKNFLLGVSYRGPHLIETPLNLGIALLRTRRAEPAWPSRYTQPHLMRTTIRIPHKSALTNMSVLSGQLCIKCIFSAFSCNLVIEKKLLMTFSVVVIVVKNDARDQKRPRDLYRTGHKKSKALRRFERVWVMRFSFCTWCVMSKLSTGR